MSSQKDKVSELSLYGYIPTESVCAIFVALFGLSTLLHAGQSIYHRMWWLWGTVILAGTAEIIGWSARLWSSQNPLFLVPYEIQITTTIIAPTPFIAANFIILGRIIHLLGAEYSRLPPMLYTAVFCSFDIIALVVQAVGGASAATAVQTGKDPSQGGNIMLGGILFQMFAITVYVAFETEFLYRFFHDKPLRPRQSPNKPYVLGRRVKLLIGALMFCTLCLFIR